MAICTTAIRFATSTAVGCQNAPAPLSRPTWRVPGELIGVRGGERGERGGPWLGGAQDVRRSTFAPPDADCSAFFVQSYQGVPETPSIWQIDRDPLLRAVLRSLADWYGEWRAAGGDPDASRLRQAYAAGCVTLGRAVRAELPAGETVTGTAVAVDDDGRLVIATEGGTQGEERAIGAGDVVHLRAGEPPQPPARE